MNITFDEYGPVDMDELTAIHHAKMEWRFNETTEQKKIGVESNISNNMYTTSTDVNSQECVEIGSKRSNITWAALRMAHKNIIQNKGGRNRKPTYAEVTAE